PPDTTLSSYTTLFRSRLRGACRGGVRFVSQHTSGLVVAAFGRHYTVELPDGTTRQCYPRGKKGAAAVGDIVNISLQGVSEGAIRSEEHTSELQSRENL